MTDVPHISASQINRFLTEPALWVVEKFFNIKSTAGPGAWRGSACEAAMDVVLFQDADDAAALAAAHDRFEQDAQGDLSADVVKARDELTLYLANLLPVARKLRAEKGTPLVRQARIELDLPGITARLIGYVDYLYDDFGLDLKTVGRLPSFTDADPPRIKDKADHLRQMAIYATAKSRPFKLLYVTPGKKKDPVLYPVCDEEVSAGMRQVMAAARAMDRLLKNPDPSAWSMMYPPRDLDGYMWDDVTRTKAREIWNL